METIPEILVIDSDDISVLIIKYCFFVAGLQPAWKHIKSGNEALNYLKQPVLPGLVLLEPMLPDMQYDEFLRALDSLDVFQKTRVCLLTNFLLDDLENLGREYAVFERFAKPFHKGHLEALHRKLLPSGFLEGA